MSMICAISARDDERRQLLDVPSRNGRASVKPRRTTPPCRDLSSFAIRSIRCTVFGLGWDEPSSNMSNLSLSVRLISRPSLVDLNRESGLDFPCHRLGRGGDLLLQGRRVGLVRQGLRRLRGLPVAPSPGPPFVARPAGPPELPSVARRAAFDCRASAGFAATAGAGGCGRRGRRRGGQRLGLRALPRRLRPRPLGGAEGIAIGVRRSGLGGRSRLALRLHGRLAGDLVQRRITDTRTGSPRSSAPWR